MSCRAPHGNNRENAPFFHSQVNEVALEVVQIGKILLVHTGDDIPCDVGACETLDGSFCRDKAPFAATHPIMGLLETVKADGDGFQPSLHETVAHLLVEQHAIAHHSPVESTLTDGLSAFCDVFSDKRLPTCRYDEDFTWVHCRADIVKHR